MKQKVISFIRHPLFSGSALLIIGSNSANAINYVYHIVMGRLLGPAAYADMAALFSVIVLINMLPSSLNLVLIKHVSSSTDPVRLGSSLRWFLNKSLLVGLALSLAVLLFLPVISSFLHVSELWAIVFLGLYFIIALPVLVFRASLQGILRFGRYVASILTENIVKLLLGIVFVLMGLSVTGSLLGIFLAAIVGLFLSWWFCRDFFGKHPQAPETLKEMIKFSYPVMAFAFAFTSLFTMDVILAKHFLSPTEAGLYAALSTLGKIIIFGSSPVAGVMFPLVSRRHAEKTPYRKIFWASLGLTAAIGLTALAVYGLFPHQVLGVLYGERFLNASGFLFMFGIFSVLYSLSNFLVGFFLSLDIKSIAVFPVLAAIAQIVGISLFHSGISSVITVSLVVCSGLFLTLLLNLRHPAVKIAS